MLEFSEVDGEGSGYEIVVYNDPLAGAPEIRM
jgi:hypothetical protein